MADNNNLVIWNKVKQPPASALKKIEAGRLRGKSDINPQWRYQIMTEVFGPCGVGWYYKVERLWTEPAPDNQVFAFAEINLWVKIEGKWSEAIPGIGGSMLVAEEKSGLHANDEAYKMAVTDALSVALKMLGVGADVYAGLWDGTKYREETPQVKLPKEKLIPPKNQTTEPSSPIVEEILTDDETFKLNIAEAMNALGWGIAELIECLKTNFDVDKLGDLDVEERPKLIKFLQQKIDEKNQ